VQEENVDDALDDENFELLFGTDAEQNFWDEREIAEAEQKEAQEDAEYKLSVGSSSNLAQHPPQDTACARARLREHNAAICVHCGGIKDKDAQAEASAPGSAMQLD
jgi:hypothetical protein